MKKIINTIILSAITILIYSQSICVGTPGQITWEQYRGLYDDEINELTSWPDYPNHPFEKKLLYNTKSLANYDNSMGAIIRGFIYVPQSDSVTFNLTGNEQARFFLSTDANPQNKVLRAYLNTNSGAEEYDRYPTQTSNKIYLQAGINYYFEILYVDGTGADYANLYWKAPFVDVNTWKPITAEFLKNIGCQPAQCAKLGTPCNDGNTSTVGDIEDGNCNCFGKQPSSNSCIGERGKIINYRYDNIAGSTLSNLLTNSNFPSMPTFSEVIPLLGKATTTNTDYGRMTQAYLNVPISGLYKFNLTGNDQTIFYISSDDSPANKSVNQCYVSGSTGPTSHDIYSTQSTGFIYLDATKYYYIEVINKQGSGSAHFGVFWQTPFGQPGVWKRISNAYVYNYDCTLACMPQGLACDDGNIFTNNDIYDNDCNCAGTPCTGSGCDNPIASYVPFDKCNVTQAFDNRADKTWVSCAASPNPNSVRPVSHWIKYDLGEKHKLLTSQIWNYNVSGSTTYGMESVVIDYSTDGLSWSTLNAYTWPLATGEGGYAGFVGPDFQGVMARYVLITSLDNTSSCRGISKVAFKAVYCPNQGTACNDRNAETIDDRYNNNCECIGLPIAQNLCDSSFLQLGPSLLLPTNYSAIMHVTSQSQIAANNTTSFIGGNYIELNPGFNSQVGAVFLAAIDTCNTDPISLARSITSPQNKPIVQSKDQPIKWLSVSLNEDSEEAKVTFFVDKSGSVDLKILDATMTPIYTLAHYHFPDSGYFYKQFRTKKLSTGIYTLQYNKDGQTFYERLKI
jgi:hypothetical protein